MSSIVFFSPVFVFFYCFCYAGWGSILTQPNECSFIIIGSFLKFNKFISSIGDVVLKNQFSGIGPMLEVSKTAHTILIVEDSACTKLP